MHRLHQAIRLTVFPEPHAPWPAQSECRWTTHAHDTSVWFPQAPAAKYAVHRPGSAERNSGDFSISKTSTPKTKMKTNASDATLSFRVAFEPKNSYIFARGPKYTYNFFCRSQKSPSRFSASKPKKKRVRTATKIQCEQKRSLLSCRRLLRRC